MRTRDNNNGKREGTMDNNKGQGRMRKKPRENDKGQQGHRKREGVRNGGGDNDTGK